MFDTKRPRGEKQMQVRQVEWDAPAELSFSFFSRPLIILIIAQNDDLQN